MLRDALGFGGSTVEASPGESHEVQPIFSLPVAGGGWVDQPFLVQQPIVILEPLLCRPFEAGGENDDIKWVRRAVIKYDLASSYAFYCWQDLNFTGFDFFDGTDVNDGIFAVLSLHGEGTFCRPSYAVAAEVAVPHPARRHH